MLNQFAEKLNSKVFTKYGCFFAFSNEQLKKGIKRDFGKYASVGSGLYIPSIFTGKVIDKLNTNHDRAIKQVMESNTKKEIIWYELSNHEAQITGDIDDSWDALECYPHITKQNVIDEYRAYYKNCVDNDYF